MKSRRSAQFSERFTADQALFRGPALPDFRDTDPWRVQRIAGEFVEGFDALADVHRAVAVFGSARIHENDPWYGQARETGRLLGEAGYAVITGGGPGIMEAANRGAHEAGARSIGLNIELPHEQHVNPYVDLEVDFRYFFVRKTMFVKYSQAFVVFPGGFGTLDELFEALTLIQTGKVERFVVILVSVDYWAGLLRWMESRLVAEGKIDERDLKLIEVTDDPAHVVEIVRAYDPRDDRTSRKRGK